MNWAKIKFTPLNVVIALCFTYIVYCLLGLNKQDYGMSNSVKIAYTLVLAVILFLTDILFRRFIESKKWIWLIQSSFILLIIIMMIIFQNI